MSNEPTIRVATDLPQSLVEELDEFCKKKLQKRSQAVRTILKEYFSKT